MGLFKKMQKTSGENAILLRIIQCVRRRQEEKGKAKKAGNKTQQSCHKSPDKNRRLLFNGRLDRPRTRPKIKHRRRQPRGYDRLETESPHMKIVLKIYKTRVKSSQRQKRSPANLPSRDEEGSKKKIHKMVS